MASKGDIRVLLVMDAVLSFVFTLLVFSGLDFVDLVAFSWPRVGLATAALFVITYMAVIR